MVTKQDAEFTVEQIVIHTSFLTLIPYMPFKTCVSLSSCLTLCLFCVC